MIIIKFVYTHQHYPILQDSSLEWNCCTLNVNPLSANRHYAIISWPRGLFAMFPRVHDWDVGLLSAAWNPSCYQSTMVQQVAKVPNESWKERGRRRLRYTPDGDRLRSGPLHTVINGKFARFIQTHARIFMSAWVPSACAMPLFVWIIGYLLHGLMKRL